VVYDGVTADQSNGLIPFSSLQNFLQGIVAAGGTIQGGNPAFNARPTGTRRSLRMIGASLRV
jgi:hypothetical protein